jgi:hypothetical protein
VQSVVRDDVVRQLRSATSPNEMSTAVFAARRWLADHPGDEQVEQAMADLIQMERSYVDGSPSPGFGNAA